MRTGLLLLLLPVCPAAEDANWIATSWRDSPAWSSSVAGWTAVVCPALGRLVSLQPDGGPEFLQVVAGTPGDLRASGGALGVLGGHQCWLGPQSGWDWPPPAGWERAAAELSETAGGTLRLAFTAVSPWPTLQRSYRWDGAVLVATVAWDAPRPAFAMQLLSLQPAVQMSVRRTVEDGLPHGFAVRTPASGLAIERVFDLPIAGIDIDGVWLRLVRANGWVKVHAAEQALTASLGSANISITRGASKGRRIGEPDHGLVSQVFIGADSPYVEIEQMSPVLSGPDAVNELRVRCTRTP